MMTSLFDSHEKCVYVVISVGPAARVWRGKNVKVAIFLDTIHMMNVQLCMIVLLSELYTFIPLTVTLNIFQSHSTVSVN